MTEEDLIAGCKRNNRSAQKILFERYSPLMLGVCRRYVKNDSDAEDVLLNGFFKVLTKIDHFKGEGSFEGWIRRIMVNEALMHLRQNQHFQHLTEISPNIMGHEEPMIEEDLTAAEIIKLLDELPPGYRTVFNLYVLEGYKHREIAEELGVSINTSKSQLILAKQRMAVLVTKRLGIEGFEND